ncbi:MAG: hypothetical protein ACX930_10530 [Erythrobacter sp.]
MIKNVVGAIVGSKLAQNSTNVGNTAGAATGAIAGTVLPFVLSRMSLPALVAIGAGGYLLKRYRDKQETADTATTPTTPDVTGVPVAA